MGVAVSVAIIRRFGCGGALARASFACARFAKAGFTVRCFSGGFLIGRFLALNFLLDLLFYMCFYSEINYKQGRLYVPSMRQP